MSDPALPPICKWIRTDPRDPRQRTTAHSKGLRVDHFVQPCNKQWCSVLRPGWYAYYLLQIYRKVSVPIYHRKGLGLAQLINKTLNKGVEMQPWLIGSLLAFLTQGPWNMSDERVSKFQIGWAIFFAVGLMREQLKVVRNRWSHLRWQLSQSLHFDTTTPTIATSTTTITHFDTNYYHHY